MIRKSIGLLAVLTLIWGCSQQSLLSKGEFNIVKKETRLRTDAYFVIDSTTEKEGTDEKVK